MKARTTLTLALLCSSAALAVACGGAEAPRYYTLVRPVTHAADSVKEADFAIEVLPVDVPQQVDTPLMVVRRSEGQILPVDSRRWIAPLPDELRAAFSNAISTTLNARDVNGVSPPAGMPSYRIKVVVRRFDSAVDVSADVDALWSIRITNDTSNKNPDAGPSTEPPQTGALTCEARVTEKADSGFEGLALAHQKAAADIADKISATLVAMRANPTGAVCPK